MPDDDSKISIGTRTDLDPGRGVEPMPGMEDYCRDEERFRELRIELVIPNFFGKESQAEQSLRSVLKHVWLTCCPDAYIETHSIRPAQGEVMAPTAPQAGPGSGDGPASSLAPDPPPPLDIGDSTYE